MNLVVNWLWLSFCRYLIAQTEHADWKCNNHSDNDALIIEASISKVTEISDLACVIKELKK